jgi:hypothetical protein
LKTNTPQFAPGFRIFVQDWIVLLIGIGLFFGLLKKYEIVSLVIAFVTGHFFLFCNVFRISRGLEFIWAGVFIAFSGPTIVDGFPNWSATIIISLGTTIAVVVYEMKKPSYHGIFWQQINPGLKAWWDSNLSLRGYN